MGLFGKKKNGKSRGIFLGKNLRKRLCKMQHLGR